ncbi:penicillin-binding protein 1C [Limibacter armeniacum]|uniref:penicillin-binding protein 1C n=1 Tax=Limibacter armeniacum TaxID=466084 RepID=UPI002FE5D16E
MLLLHFIFPFQPKIPYSQVILSDQGDVIDAFLSKDDKWRMRVELNEVSETLQKAIVHKEDKYFYYHLGINPFAISRAFIKNILTGHTTSGASTITMQVARLLDPKPRTYVNKLVEAFRALQLELQFSKDEILELYLNLVPYGGNIEGVKAASMLYLGKQPDQLSLSQATVLSIIPNRPTSLALGKDNTAIVRARNKWLKIFQQDDLFENTLIEDAYTEPLIAYRRSLKRIIPHLGTRLRYQIHTDRILTHIDTELQQRASHLTAQYISRQQQYGIYNASVIIVENATRNVVAYVGSPDFYSDRHSGQVDGIQAVRSPGSTLKPLVYGLAFDMGVLTPNRIMLDVPSVFGTYIPQNFDEKFHGKLTVTDALAKSLNIPAVQALDKIGVNNLIASLKRAGFNNIAKQEYKLGLSLALGGCGVSLEELAGLYCSMANKGLYAPLRYTQLDTVSSTASVLSDAASYMISDILQEPDRPDLPNAYLNSVNLPKVAWKTGTSYGRKDAWSIGFNKKYTIGVWVGNFDGTGSRELTGAHVATPLLFRLFNTIDYNSEKGWFQMPDNLEERLVCSETGRVPERTCQHLINDFYIPQVSDNIKCTHQRYVFVSDDSSISYCSQCLPSAGYKKLLYPNINPALVTYFEEKDIPYKRIPMHNPACKAIVKDNPPKITSPLENREYLIGDEATELLLSCQAANDVDWVYWYINDQFYKKSPSEENVFFNPPKGKVKISCSDDKGRNHNIFITVL